MILIILFLCYFGKPYKNLNEVSYLYLITI